MKLAALQMVSTANVEQNCETAQRLIAQAAGEGAKLVAKLRATKTDKNVLLLKANLGAGHGGSSGRYDALHEAAFDYAYALWQMGITK